MVDNIERIDAIIKKNDEVCLGFCKKKIIKIKTHPKEIMLQVFIIQYLILLLQTFYIIVEMNDALVFSLFPPFFSFLFF